MRLATLLGPDLAALTSDPEALKETFEDFHPEDVAELLEDLPPETLTGIVRALPTEMGADLVERLSPDRQESVITELRPAVAAELLAELDPDDRVDLLQELEEDDAEKLLAQLATDEPEAHEETQELLAFAPESAGGLMTTEYVGLPPDMKLWEAIEEVRRLSRENEAETIHYVYVVGYGEKLLGVISLRDLILKDPGQTLADVMSEKVVRVPPETDQEEVARLIARYDLTAMPVVDPQEGMLGVVTVDDVVDVVIEEATEDAQKQGGVVPLEDAYFSTGLVEFVWKRGIWLIVLFLGQLHPATLLEQNRVVLLATV
ncbi:MAG: magnesium transporter, partial [Myxococcota bacterium]